MNTDFKNLMVNQSDEGLQKYITNRLKFTPEAVEAAIDEVQRRGISYSEDELNQFRMEVQQKRDADLQEVNQEQISVNKWKRNVVQDESAPEYYSERAIYMFSILFSMFFGAVLLATNLGQSENKDKIAQVIGFGFGFTALMVLVLSQFASNSGLTLGFNIVGALILQEFWKRNIGKDTKYRAKSIVKPLIVSLIIVILIFIALVYIGVDE